MTTINATIVIPPESWASICASLPFSSETQTNSLVSLICATVSRANSDILISGTSQSIIVFVATRVTLMFAYHRLCVFECPNFSRYTASMTATCRRDIAQETRRKIPMQHAAGFIARDAYSLY